MGAKKKLKSLIEIQVKVIQAERQQNRHLNFELDAEKKKHAPCKAAVTSLRKKLEESKNSCDELQFRVQTYLLAEKKHPLRWAWMKPNRDGLWWYAGSDISDPSPRRTWFWACLGGKDLEEVTEGYWCRVSDIPYVSPGLEIEEEQSNE